MFACVCRGGEGRRRIAFAKREDLETLVSIFDQGQEFVIFSSDCLDISANIPIDVLVPV